MLQKKLNIFITPLNKRRIVAYLFIAAKHVFVNVLQVAK